VVAQVRRCLDHTPGIAGETYSPALAGEGHQKVVPAVATASAGKAVGEDAAFQILLEGLAYIGLGAVVVALPVKLACAGQLKPGLVMLGHCLVQQRALGVARVLALGLTGGGMGTVQTHSIVQTSPRPGYTATQQTAPKGRLLSQREGADQAVTPFAFSTYSSIWLKFRYL
jgi:hypothetical protein